MMNTKTGLSIAATAAMFALASLSTAAQAEHKSAKAENVHCYGVNSCKGTSACKTAANECKGQNACKGQGFIEATAKACTAQGGSLTEKK